MPNFPQKPTPERWRLLTISGNKSAASSFHDKKADGYQRFQAG